MTGDFSTEEEDKSIIYLRQVVGSVVLLFDNLCAEELARLLFPTAPTGENIVRQILDPLHAILNVPEDLSKPIQILHLSFRRRTPFDTHYFASRLCIEVSIGDFPENDRSA